LGALLRFPYAVRSEEEYFDGIPGVKVTTENRRIQPVLI
jgi:non-homologous end joining protein Ku